MNCHVQGPACSMRPIPYLPVLRPWIGAGQVEAPGTHCRLPSVLRRVGGGYTDSGSPMQVGGRCWRRTHSLGPVCLRFSVRV